MYAESKPMIHLAMTLCGASKNRISALKGELVALNQDLAEGLGPEIAYIVSTHRSKQEIFDILGPIGGAKKIYEDIVANSTNKTAVKVAKIALREYEKCR
jgi:hypothetical protein